MNVITVAPHDPLVARDNRPFGGEGSNRARSLDWPYPSALAGAVRTLIGATLAPGAARPFDDSGLLARLKAVSVSGPLPLVGEELYFPTPHDVVAYDGGNRHEYMVLRPRPLEDGEGCNLPVQHLWPVDVTEDVKPAKADAFWSAGTVAEWLARDWSTGGFSVSGSLAGFPKDERVHVQIQGATGTADDGKLFTTEGLVISDVDIPKYQGRSGEGSIRRSWRPGVRLALLAHSDDAEIASLLSRINTVFPFGGERRLSLFRSQDDAAPWQCPDTVRRSLSQAGAVRMVLATPAVFSEGWLPGWLDPESLEGSPPDTDIRLRLRGGCVGRWRPVSGWSLEKGRRGPKPIRRLVPAGSVYFCEVVGGSAGDLADLWLKSVSDEVQERNDGFGLALWGVWDIRD